MDKVRAEFERRFPRPEGVGLAEDGLYEGGQWVSFYNAKWEAWQACADRAATPPEDIIMQDWLYDQQRPGKVFANGFTANELYIAKQAWKASRERLVIDLPILLMNIVETEYEDGQQDAAEKCAAAVHAAGVTVLCAGEPYPDCAK